MKDSFFPHGDTSSDEMAFIRCLWRETSYAHHLLKKAVSPKLSLGQSIKNWKNISQQLAEKPRKRKIYDQSQPLLS
jgi:hypothetical protein